MSKTRNSWLAAGLTLLLVSGAPGFVAPSLMQTAEAQSQKITGTVVDEFGDPVIGANIRVKGTTIGGITNMDGVAVIQGVPNNATIQVSYVGYITQEIALQNNQTTLEVTLREDSISFYL